ncbi:MBL fold metallo-hydrolase [Acidianus infernus]|uniref:MBL fold metallo-hydrolase n=1 Tax=Acidianus infernus TaxID=12915 RepID=A0A6A9QPB9_ACIIN|nr:MBL fold metallo-hydrolase [Acidianus infernus]MCY0882266.1 MBL fold metallo-hydrolase [Acidianus infernus]MUM65047.1 MBL fold metallo-hydrolase [Acidianus infernus]
MKRLSELKITILSDNFVSTIIPPLIGEWGFSALIEADGTKILYDVGNSGYPVLYNAEKLGIDLSKVDYIVLSHGHSDHTGGFSNPKLVKKLEGKIVIAHPSVFEKKLLNWSGKLEYIGIPMSLDEMEKHFHVILTSQPLEITEGVIFSGEVKRYGYDEYTSGLFTARDSSISGDHMKDDAALYMNTEKGLVILTGCGHSGILNIINHAKEVTSENVYAALGGFHLLSSPKDKVVNVSEELLKLGKVGPAHCSGNLIKSLIAEHKDKFLDAGVGKVIKFSESLQ